jgi:hypothetical protein
LTGKPAGQGLRACPATPARGSLLSAALPLQLLSCEHAFDHDLGWECDHPPAPRDRQPAGVGHADSCDRRRAARPVALEDALAILLALIDREPETFPRAAARWGGRLVVERRLLLVDAQLALAALAALPGPGAGAGGEALIEISERYGLRRVDDLVGDWLRTR